MHDIVNSGASDGRGHYMLQWLDSHASGSTASERCHPGGEDFADRLYQCCLHALQDFYRQERDQRSSSSNSIILRECLGRFYLWGEPFGAGDLDEALRQSEELKDDVLERLGHIGKLLLRALSKPPLQPLHQLSNQIKELESFVKQIKPIIHGDQDEILQGDREADEEDVPETEDLSDCGSYDITEDIDFTVRCLTELGPSLAQNLQHAENARNQHLCLTGVPFSVSGPAKTYVSLVREKFNKAPYRLVERLGEANWQRHMDIREKGESTEKLTSKTGIACSVFRPYSDFHDSGIGTSVPAHTNYAPSHTSFQSSNIEGDHVTLRVPREPAEVSAGKQFECFLCRRIISNVRNRVDWKMHVFADLRPYICTFSDCKDELAQFTTRAAWADHEFTEHRNDQTWNCPECSANLADASSWEQHLHKIHRCVFTGPQLHVARNAALKTYPRPIETEECPLCRIVLGKQRRAFVKHIGRHMEEIALMALPRDTEEDSDDSSSLSDCSLSLQPFNENVAKNNSTDQEKKTRVLFKCSPCRQRKLKCLPQPRDWEDTKQKCQHCQALGLSCGPNYRKSQDPAAIRPVNENPIAYDRSDSQGLWNHEVLAAKTGSGTSEETSHYQTDSKATIDKVEGSGGFASADAKRRRGRAALPGRCHSCNRGETSHWRRGPDGARTLCNACGLHFAKLRKKLAACCRCRTRKTRCEPGLPRCGPCERSGAVCEYFDTTQGRNILGTYVIHLQNKTQALEADFDELPHPSLTRTRHPVYGNSVFSEGQGVYRTNRANDDITEVQHQPPISPSPERHSIPNDRGGSPVVTPIQPPIYTPHHTSEREPRRRRRPLSVIVHQSSEEDEDDSQSPPEVNYKSGPRIRSLSPTTRYVTGSSQLGQVEDYIIKCICGSREDDGNTVYCDLCHTWQHTGCYYIDKHGNLPTKEELEVIDHFCVRCRPRSVNAKDVIEGVIERQQTRREDLESSTTHDGPVKGQVSFEMGDEDQEHEGWAEESNSLSPIITRRGSAPTNVDSRLESFCSYRDSRGVLHRGLKPQYHVPHLVNGVPAEPPSFQYRRDSSGNLYQVPYVPPAGHKPPQLEDLPATVEEQRKAGTSSYWSVAEQRDYYYYIRYLGTDWKAMSTKLTTKTPQMIKNFYSRKPKDGEFEKQLKEDIARADRNRAEGVNIEPTPPPPLPPPRYIDDITAGSDPGWAWGNEPKPPPLPPPRYIDDITAGSDPGWAWGNEPKGGL